jgi:tellurite resistance protein
VTAPRRPAAARPSRKRSPAKKLTTDQALVALFIAAMDANGHVSREELARAQHLIWSTRQFRRKSGERVGALIDRMRTRVEEQGSSTVVRAAAAAIPRRLRAASFAVVADLLLADGTLDARERRFLHGLAADLGMDGQSARQIVDVILLKNRL